MAVDRRTALKTVSVAVLNYNYARYLPARLESVFAQTYPVQEILLLDDASTDNSLAVATQTAAAAKRDVRIIANEVNGGSVFAQWRRAALAAKGEYLWLCEADDEANETFLARLIEAIGAAPDTLLAFTDSRAVDEAGREVSPSYQSYYFESGVKELAATRIWDGEIFARRNLSVRNLILNVSAVLWRRDALLRALESCPDLPKLTLAGDWRLYLAALTCQAGKVVFIAEPLNTHRRHSQGVTQRIAPAAHVEDIARMHRLAATALDLDEPTIAAQSAYLNRISAQLGVTKARAAKPVARKAKV